VVFTNRFGHMLELPIQGVLGGLKDTLVVRVTFRLELPEFFSFSFIIMN